MACDILHRFCINLPEDRIGQYDWRLVGLCCFQIAAKLTSTHFGGAPPLVKFFIENCSKPCKVSDSLKMQKAVDTELQRCEQDILRANGFNFSSLTDLPLWHIRKFMQKDRIKRESIAEKVE